MVLGVGTDVVAVARVKDALLRHPRLRDRLFTEGEREACFRLRDPYPSCAARFAAKEAFLKALGTGWGEGIRWREVEVVGRPGTRPRIAVHGRAAEIFARAGGSAIHLTMSHDAGVALATCVIEGPAAAAL